MAIGDKDNLQYLSKVIAALAAMIPIVVTWDALEAKLTTEQAKLLQNPFVGGTLIFGTAFASNGDPKATATAMAIAYVFLEMYRGANTPYRDTEEWAFRRRRTF